MGQRQVGKDLREPQPGAELGRDNHLVAGVFAKPGLDRKGDDQPRIVHRGHGLIAQVADIGGQLHDDRRLVAVFAPRGGARQRTGIGLHKRRVHLVAQHDHVAQPLGQIHRRFAEIAGIDLGFIDPAVVKAGDSTQVGAKETGDALDLGRHARRVIDRHLHRRDRRVGADRRLEALAPPLRGAAIRHDVADQPGGVAQGEIALLESVALSRRGVDAVAGKEGVGGLAAHRVVPEGPGEHVVALPKTGEIRRHLDPGQGVVGPRGIGLGRAVVSGGRRGLGGHAVSFRVQARGGAAPRSSFRVWTARALRAKVSALILGMPHDPADLFRRALCLGVPAATGFGGRRPAGCAVGHRAGLYRRTDRRHGVGAFPGLLHRLLVGTAPDGHGWPFPRLCRLCRSWHDRHHGAYDVGRSLGLGIDADGLRAGGGGVLHDHRGLAAIQGHEPDARARDGGLPDGGRVGQPGRAGDDRLSDPGRLCQLQPAGAVHVRGAVPAAADPGRGPGGGRGPPLASQAGLGQVAAGRGGGRRFGDHGRGISHGRPALRHCRRARGRPNRAVPVGLCGGRGPGAIPHRLGRGQVRPQKGPDRDLGRVDPGVWRNGGRGAGQHRHDLPGRGVLWLHDLSDLFHLDRACA